MKPVYGNPCNLYQGQYLEQGIHVFRFLYKAAGAFTAFAKYPDGNYVGKRGFIAAPGSYCKGKPWQDGEFVFTAQKSALYHIGLECNYEEALAVYFTDCRIED